MQGSLRERSAGVWEMRAYAGKVDGKSRYVSRAFHGGRRAAEKELRAFVTEVETLRETDRAALLERRRRGPTVGDAMEGWWREEGRRLDAAATARDHLDAWILPALGSVPLERLRGRVAVDGRDVSLTAFYAGLVAVRTGKPLAPATVARIHGTLRAGLAWAVSAGWIATNPAAEARRPAVRRRTPTVPEPELLLAFMARVAADHPRLHLWLCLVASGARPVEVHALRWANVDLGRGELRLWADGVVRTRVVGARERAEVRRGETRKRRMRRITLDDYALAALRTARDPATVRRAGIALGDGALIFSSDGTGAVPLTPTWARQAFSRHLARARAAGLALPDGFRPYDLRHFLGSQAIAAGVGVAEVAARMGNTPSTVHRTYVHPVSDGDRKIAGLMSSAWGGLPVGKGELTDNVPI